MEDSHKSSKEMELVTVRDEDILLGRGKTAFTHVGNEYMRLEIAKRSNCFKNAKTRFCKSCVVREILTCILKRGGRFLKRHKNGWINATFDDARSRVSHALRDLIAGKIKSFPPVKAAKISEEQPPIQRDRLNGKIHQEHRKAQLSFLQMQFAEKKIMRPPLPKGFTVNKFEAQQIAKPCGESKDKKKSSLQEAGDSERAPSKEALDENRETEGEKRGRNKISDGSDTFEISKVAIALARKSGITVIDGDNIAPSSSTRYQLQLLFGKTEIHQRLLQEANNARLLDSSVNHIQRPMLDETAGDNLIIDNGNQMSGQQQQVLPNATEEVKKICESLFEKSKAAGMLDPSVYYAQHPVIQEARITQATCEAPSERSQLQAEVERHFYSLMRRQGQQPFNASNASQMNQHAFLMDGNNAHAVAMEEAMTTNSQTAREVPQGQNRMQSEVASRFASTQMSRQEQQLFQMQSEVASHRGATQMNSHDQQIRQMQSKVACHLGAAQITIQEQQLLVARHAAQVRQQRLLQERNMARAPDASVNHHTQRSLLEGVVSRNLDPNCAAGIASAGAGADSSAMDDLVLSVRTAELHNHFLKGHENPSHEDPSKDQRLSRVFGIHPLDIYVGADEVKPDGPVSSKQNTSA